MYIVAKTVGDVFENPLGIVRHAASAERILGAPAELCHVNVNDLTLCEKERPFVFSTYEDALKAQDRVTAEISAIKGRVFVEPCMKVHNGYPPKITALMDGTCRLSVEVYITAKRLPVGRTIKEALNDPLGYRPTRKASPELEGQNLALKSAMLSKKYKTKSGAVRAYGSMIKQGSIKLVKKDGVWRPRLRYLKAPKWTYQRDRRRIKFRAAMPLGDTRKTFPIRASLDLFNPNVVLVLEEGSGRSMSD